MIADHATTSELGGFYAQFPITLYMPQSSNHFLHATGIYLVIREFSPFRGFPEEENVQQQRYSGAILAIRTLKCAPRSELCIEHTSAGIEPQLAELLPFFRRQPEFQYITPFRIQYLRDFIPSKARDCA